MSSDNEGSATPDVPEPDNEPATPQPQLETGSLPARDVASTRGKMRREEIRQRRRQHINRLAARQESRNFSSLPTQSGQELNPAPQDGNDETDIAHSVSTSPATRSIEQVATTSKTIEKVGGEGNTTIQGENIQIYIQKELTKDFVGGTFEKVFKAGASLDLDATGEGDENSFTTTTASSLKMPMSVEKKFIKGIKSSATGAAFVHQPRSKGKGRIRAIPKNDREIGHWYYQVLNEKERCFVKAAAVLHGAPLRAMAEATRELYAPLRKQDEARQAQVQPQATQMPPDVEQIPTTPPSSVSEFLVRMYGLIQQEERKRSAQTQFAAPQAEAASPATPDFSLGSIDDLLHKTYTTTQRVNGATRLFWQDADDASGLSPFSINLLRFLSREIVMEDMFGAQEGEQFLNVISQWPAKYRGERSWRSASALGVIWWHQDARNLLWRQASKWAKSQREEDWEHAAALLDGAYQVERDTMKTGVDDAAGSSVLRLLDQWISVAHQAHTQRGEGFAAARAYALIGRKSPEVALRGLERLLCFPQPQGINEGPRYPPEDLFVFGVLKYVDIVKSGHIRQALKFLASEAENYAHLRNSHQRGERRESYHQRIAALYLIFPAFYLIASCSLSAVDDRVDTSYSSTSRLPNHPACPDGNGRDVLLAGLLTEEDWQNRLATLLCALILEKNYQPAIYLMRRWGEIVLKASQTSPDLEEKYAGFLIKVGELIRIWSADRGAVQLFAFSTYRYQLELWLTDRRLPQPGFAQLAKKVLEKLPKMN